MTVTQTPVVLVLGALVALMTLAPRVGSRAVARRDVWVATCLALATLFVPTASLAYGLAALTAAWLARLAWGSSRTGSGMLVVVAALTAVAGYLIQYRAPSSVGWFLSLLAIALRAGFLAFHPGIVALSRQAPHVQHLQLATFIAPVFVHLVYADHVYLAHDWAQPVVYAGALSALIFALVTLVQSDLRGLLINTTLMHGGLVLAALGAAGRGHHVAALFVSLSTVLAMSGLGTAVEAVEARSGNVELGRAGGRARSFPRLAAAFAVFGAAGVGMPGTAGFIADDLIMHALWEESVAATVIVVVATAVVAVSTLRALTLVFFGKPVRSVAPDLLPNERRYMLTVILVLFAIGLFPQTIVASAMSLLDSPARVTVSCGC